MVYQVLEKLAVMLCSANYATVQLIPNQQQAESQPKGRVFLGIVHFVQWMDIAYSNMMGPAFFLAPPHMRMQCQCTAQHVPSLFFLPKGQLKVELYKRFPKSNFLLFPVCSQYQNLQSSYSNIDLPSEVHLEYITEILSHIQFSR